MNKVNVLIALLTKSLNWKLVDEVEGLLNKCNAVIYTSEDSLQTRLFGAKVVNAVRQRGNTPKINFTPLSVEGNYFYCIFNKECLEYSDGEINELLKKTYESWVAEGSPDLYLYKEED